MPRESLGAAAKGKREPLSSSILTRLRSEILNGQFVPGDRINVDQVRLSYGVSLSPLREALSKLVSDGLVEADEQRGFRVTPISEANLRELMWLRKLMEGAALQRSMELGGDDWGAEVVATLHRLERLTVRKRDSGGEIDEDWEHWHRQFHIALISACDSPLLRQFCVSLHDLTDRYRRIFNRLIKTNRQPGQEHRDIATAALERDATTALKLMERHIERTGADILVVMPHHALQVVSEE